ncbi:hypothetical protein [Clostridium botulinum]|uniref:Putative hepA/SNF2 n=1 Tax=Clostridium botulinum TaxID=1491 RepID=A0A1L7JP82_CLOBO|nr:hypothetical protein [Clostridium botulinum]APU87333.1 putative hepA/SNF2 [Clostridium botulinum]
MINIIGDKSILINKRNDCEPKKEIVLKDDFLKKKAILQHNKIERKL